MAVPFKFKQAARGNYLPGRAGKVEYIVIHYTGIPNDTAENNAVYSAREFTGVSAHYFVDKREVWQSVREEDTAYHCGSTHPKHPTCRNYNSIGVEMCDSVGTVPAATRERMKAVVRELMDKYGVPVENVLRHYDVTGKRCPAPWVDNPEEWEKFKSMLEVIDLTEDQVRQIVRDEMAAQESKRNNAAASGWAVEYIQRAIQAGILTGVDDGAGGLTIASPQGNSTRQEMATMGVAILEKMRKI